MQWPLITDKSQDISQRWKGFIVQNTMMSVLAPYLLPCDQVSHNAPCLLYAQYTLSPNPIPVAILASTILRNPIAILGTNPTIVLGIPMAILTSVVSYLLPSSLVRGTCQSWQGRINKLGLNIEGIAKTSCVPLLSMLHCTCMSKSVQYTVYALYGFLILLLAWIGPRV